MGIDITTEKRLEEDIESFFLSGEGGYTKNHDTYNHKLTAVMLMEAVWDYIYAGKYFI